MMLTTLAAPRAISADPLRCRATSWSCHSTSRSCQPTCPATAHPDPATLIDSVPHLHICFKQFFYRPVKQLVVISENILEQRVCGHAPLVSSHDCRKSPLPSSTVNTAWKCQNSLSACLLTKHYGCLLTETLYFFRKECN